MKKDWLKRQVKAIQNVPDNFPHLLLKENKGYLDDKEFLQWIFERLNLVHKENENFDYMHRLKAIIELMPEGRCSKANGCITKNAYIDLKELKLEDFLQLKPTIGLPNYFAVWPAKD